MRRKVLLPLLVLAMAIGMVSAPSSASASVPGVPVDYAIHHAVDYAYAHGYRTGISVLDTATGAFWQAGSPYSFASESVVKVLIATEILLQGRMHGTTASIAYKMITQSDDASATRLYGGVGGDSVINRIEAHYHLNIGFPPHHSGWWGNTHLYTKGLVYFYRAVRHDARVWPWLGNAMHHSTVYGSDGFYQHFGIPSATTGYAVKQGWGIDDDCFCHAAMNSTGFVGGDRYAVAIFTSGPASTYGSTMGRMVTAEARLLMPSGYLDRRENHNPHMALWWVHPYGNVLHLMGWAIDPDARSTRLTLHIYSDGHLIRSTSTYLNYAALNARWPGASGTHAFYVTDVYVPNGRHSICVRAFNVGYGTTDPLTCLPASVNGSPGGHLESATAAADRSVTLKGWAIDRDNFWRSSNFVQVHDGTRYVGTYRADLPRPDVNAYWRITGNHGFLITLPDQSPGVHNYRLDSMNIGYPNPSVPLNGVSGTVTVPAAAPLPAAKSTTKASGTST
jgi:hypothetical protein